MFGLVWGGLVGVLAVRVDRGEPRCGLVRGGAFRADRASPFFELAVASDLPP
jgi:hypothetical protein